MRRPRSRRNPRHAATSTGPLPLRRLEIVRDATPRRPPSTLCPRSPMIILFEGCADCTQNWSSATRHPASTSTSACQSSEVCAFRLINCRQHDRPRFLRRRRIHRARYDTAHIRGSGGSQRQHGSRPTRARSGRSGGRGRAGSAHGGRGPPGPGPSDTALLSMTLDAHAVGTANTKKNRRLETTTRTSHVCRARRRSRRRRIGRRPAACRGRRHGPAGCSHDTRASG